MESSSQKSSPKSKQHEDGHFMSWGGLSGAVLGAALGLFVGHWIISAFLLGGTGLVIGGLIDRSRR